MASYEQDSSTSSNIQFPRPPVYPDNPCELFNLSSRLLLPLYDITKCLGKGGFGAVYQATDRYHRQCAIKIQSKQLGDNPTLTHELGIYQRLYFDKRTGFPTTGIPKVYNYIEVENHEFLIMEQCGDSIETIMGKQPRGIISKKSALMIGIQALRILETLHTHGILHRDIKPGNIAMGLGAKDERTVHLLDFGLASVVEDWAEYDIEEEMPFQGTDYFAPFETLFKKKPTRSGDVQSLAYTILCMALGDLPWSYHDEETGNPLTLGQLGIQRIRCKADNLCRGFPELTQFMKVVSRAKRREAPDYDKLVGLLEEALWSMNCENDGKFEWLEPSGCESGNIAREYTYETSERDLRLSPDHFYDDFDFTEESNGIHAPSPSRTPAPTSSRVRPESPRASVTSTSRIPEPESSRISVALSSRVLVPDSSIITDVPSTRVILEQPASNKSWLFEKLRIFQECNGEMYTNKIHSKLPLADQSWTISESVEVSSLLNPNIPVTDMPLQKTQYTENFSSSPYGSQIDYLKQESHIRHHQENDSQIDSNLRDVAGNAPTNNESSVDVPANEGVNAFAGADHNLSQASEQDCREHDTGKKGNELDEGLKSIAVHHENLNRINVNPPAINKYSAVDRCQKLNLKPRRRTKRGIAKKMVIKGVNWVVRKVAHDSISSLGQCGGLLV